MRRLDRPGIFKARPLSWSVHTAESGAVAVAIEYLILAQLDGTEWIDWSGAEEHSIFGDTYVVKKDGSVNTSVVEQLVVALGWNGDLRSIAGRPPTRRRSRSRRPLRRTEPRQRSRSPIARAARWVITPGPR